MPGRRHWIPPLGLAFGQLCHGFSWLLALWIATHADLGSLPAAEIAWIHLVALGWLTTTALSILLHALPTFTDVRWRYEGLARTSLFFFALAVTAFVVAFVFAPALVFFAAIALALTLTVYLATAFVTLAPALRSPDRLDRAIARAFAATLALLFIAALLGVASASLFAAFTPPVWAAQMPPAHASVALFGWLTLLIYGVSTRTLNPMTGVRSRRPALHVIAGTATLIGALLLALCLGTGKTQLAWIGATCIALGAAAYVADVAVRLAQATITYRVPQCFVALALFWLVLALVFGAGALLGRPWQAAFAFTMLAGWAGQMVNGHIFHIGVRLIATIYRGDDDETPPSALLDARMPWVAFGAMQLAVLFVASGLIAQKATLASAGAVAGLIGWLAMLSAMTLVVRRASTSVA